MISFIKGCSIENINQKLVILYILNVADIIFTVLLIGTGFYVEANAFMVKIVQSPTACTSMKVILPACLLYWLYKRMQRASAPQLKKSNSIINAAVLSYFLINVSHLIWFALIPVFNK